MGFDYLTCGEHLMFTGPIGNSLIALSAAAAVTQKIKLMSSVVLVPLYGAAMLAKMTAVLRRGFQWPLPSRYRRRRGISP